MTNAQALPADPLAAAIARADAATPDRKFRLLNCACVRRVFHLLRDEVFRAAAAVAERHADGLASAAELGEAVRDVKRASGRRRDQEWAVYHAVRYQPGSPRDEALRVAGHTANMARDAVSTLDAASRYMAPTSFTDRGLLVSWEYTSPDGRTVSHTVGPNDPLPSDAPPEIAEAIAGWLREAREAEARDEAERRRESGAASAAFQTEVERAEAEGRAAYAAERAAQLRLLHDILGPPDPPAFDPAWRMVAVADLAGSMYADRRFDQMPAVADALEAAGCRVPIVLDHCRAAGEHARGCWVIDGLLGRT